MPSFLVIEYDRVDVTKMGDPEPVHVAGEPRHATVIDHAGSEWQAIQQAADGPGFFAALPMPELTPRAVELVIEDG